MNNICVQYLEVVMLLPDDLMTQSCSHPVGDMILKKVIPKRTQYCQKHAGTSFYSCSLKILICLDIICKYLLHGSRIIFADNKRQDTNPLWVNS